MAGAIEMSKLGWIDEGRIEERKRMSEEVKKLYPPKFVNGYTTQDAKTFWEGKLQSYDEVLSIINK